MNSNDVVLRPIVSEKSAEMMESGKYVFQVSVKANKMMIKKAITDLFGVKVETVNVINVRGKKKRVRANFGRTAFSKKAIVSLVDGEKIEIFDV